MALTITKSGPFFTTVGSAISFSALRENFVLRSDGGVSASSLVRNAIPSQNEPIVPDATENSGISSVQSNLTLSQFRNSIKYYNATHEGTETNYNIAGSINWNGNLNKTIVKSIYLTGTYGSSDPTLPAATFEGDTHNVRLYVSGSILGASGASGSGTGGDALKVNSSTGAVTVIPTSTSQIYGGGGGGARGADGLRGLNGSCAFYSYYDAARSCGSDPVCGSDFLNSKSNYGQCNCTTTYTEVWFNPPEPPYYPPPYVEPYYPPACPDPDTLILMTDGSHKRAGDLQVGDYVRTQHETTLEWGDYPILNVYTVENQKKLNLIFDGTHLICSDSHKVYVEEKGWTKVSDMMSGDVVSGYTLKEIQSYENGDVVAIEIDKAHAYISNHLLSHNLVGKGGGCPDPEVPILMADGSSKRAGDLNVGDEIRTQHEKTFEWGTYKISHKLLAQQPKFKVKFSNKEIIVSDSHCFYVENKEWTRVWELEPGDIVSGHQYISRENIGLGPVVQLEVEDAHTYISDELLSHNLLKAAPPYYPPPYYPPPYYPPPDPPSMGGGGMGGGGKKSDIRLKTNIRPIGSDLNIVQRYWNV